MRSYWLLSVVLLGGCYQHQKMTSNAEPEPDARQIVAEARAAFRNGNFARALLAYRRMQFELSAGDSLTAEARYFVAECSFQTGDYATAALAFQKVAEEFPTSEFAPLALLRDGDANMRMWRRPDVDASAGQTALATYQELLGRYPASDASARARLRIHQLNEWFAEKGYKTGMFYIRRRAFDSAIIYFKDIVASYPDTRFVPEALLRMVDTYRAIGYLEEQKETCANLRRYYPQTPGVDQRCPAETSAGAP
jgi:outer membrane protein assembly factor BamD